MTKELLRKKNKAGGMTFPRYHKAIGMNTVWFCHKHKHKDNVTEYKAQK